MAANYRAKQDCDCNADTGGDLKGGRCDANCWSCRNWLDCACQCCRPRKAVFYCVSTLLVLIVAGIFIYYYVKHPTPALKKWHDYISNLLGTRKLRFIPRSELDLPKRTHIPESMDVDPYSFFPSKDLM